MTRREFLTYIASLNITAKKAFKIAKAFSMPEIEIGVFKSKELKEILGQELDVKQSDVEAFLDKLFDKGIKLLTFEDSEYPEKLKSISDPPFYLFYKGDVSLFSKKSIAIVGTRMPTSYGKVITERFAGELARAGVVIVSGLAYGVDSISHRAALKCEGKTIAVLGGGLDKIYPKEHTDLAREIAKSGLIVSEYPPDVSPSKFTFPNRNRIVAGLSDGLCITEAGAKSGTMITKDFALDSGITIYALPGNLTSEKSEGTNKLIKSGQAILVLKADEILEDLGLNKKTALKPLVQLNLEEQMIVDFLSLGEKDAEEIKEKLNLDINKLNSLLVSLEISGIIKRMPGQRYVLS